MRNVILSAMLVSVAAITPAYAQDSAPFTGAHIEGVVGYDDLGGTNGVLYGVAAGYDFQLGGAVLGLEGEVTDSSASETETNLVAQGDSFRATIGRDLYAGVRLGFAVAPQTMIYAKGGYTNARISGTFNDGLGTTIRENFTLDGYRVGAGIEQKLSLLGSGGFAKVEYRYSNYSSVNSSTAGNLDFEGSQDRHQALIGLGIRF